METSTKIKLLSGATFAAGLATNTAFATPLIENDTLDGLPSMGTQIGDFMGNLAPGLFKFLLLLGLGVAIVAVIVAIIGVIKSKATRSVR